MTCTWAPSGKVVGGSHAVQWSPTRCRCWGGRSAAPRVPAATTRPKRVKTPTRRRPIWNLLPARGSDGSIPNAPAKLQPSPLGVKGYAGGPQVLLENLPQRRPALAGHRRGRAVGEARQHFVVGGPGPIRVPQALQALPSLEQGVGDLVAAGEPAHRLLKSRQGPLQIAARVPGFADPVARVVAELGASVALQEALEGGFRVQVAALMIEGVGLIIERLGLGRDRLRGGAGAGS